MPISRGDLIRLRSRVAGEVLNIGVNDSKRVKKGGLLVQIDPADYQAQVDQAGANVLSAQAVLENLGSRSSCNKPRLFRFQFSFWSSMIPDIGSHFAAKDPVGPTRIHQDCRQ
jgi:multidrug efflux pump subunit AcrA (membrane-fusion protein)